MDIEEQDPDYERGFELRCNGQYSAAKLYFEMVLGREPQHIKARLQMGLIQGFEGDFDGSLETLTKLSKDVPEDLEVRMQLAMTQFMLGMNDEACANVRYILSIDPTHEKALEQAAWC